MRSKPPACRCLVTLTVRRHSYGSTAVAMVLASIMVPSEPLDQLSSAGDHHDSRLGGDTGRHGDWKWEERDADSGDAGRPSTTSHPETLVP